MVAVNELTTGDRVYYKGRMGTVGLLASRKRLSIRWDDGETDIITRNEIEIASRKPAPISHDNDDYGDDDYGMDDIDAHEAVAEAKRGRRSGR